MWNRLAIYWRSLLTLLLVTSGVGLLCSAILSYYGFETPLGRVNQVLNYISDEYRAIPWLFSGIFFSVLTFLYAPSKFKKTVVKGIRALKGGIVKVKGKGNTRIRDLEAEGEGSKIEVDVEGSE